MTPASELPQAAWAVRLLGTFELRGDGQRITRLSSRFATALLARLAMWPDRSHAREELVELLWPGVSLDVGRNRLRQTLSTLKSLLEPPGAPAVQVLEADRQSIRVVPGRLWCDVAAFEAACRRADVHAAVAGYGGELLPGFYDDWVLEERSRLGNLFELAERRQSQSAVHPASLAPAPSQQTAATLERSRPGAPVRRSKLPAYLTRLFGIADSAQTLLSLVRAHRLVTVWGTGGVGKTRLALEATRLATEIGGRTEDWDVFPLVAFVSLSNCVVQEDIDVAVCEALRLPASESSSRESITLALAGRRALLVLDNAEHLLEEARSSCAQLLQDLPLLHLLLTSRHALNIEGEHAFALAPLPLPSRDATSDALAINPAIQLFVDRARMVRADFHLSRRNQLALRALVQELEGVPLAIELAAARLRSFGPAELLERLRGENTDGGSPRMDLLDRPGRRLGADARHTSIRGVVAWSWRLLTERQQELLRALTAFRGGFRVSAVQAIWDAGAAAGNASEAELLLDDLHSHALLKSWSLHDHSLRFDLYEAVREFAQSETCFASSVQAAEWRRRHRLWLTSWVMSWAATPPLDELHAEMQNIVAALSSARKDEAFVHGARLFVSLAPVLEQGTLPISAYPDIRSCVEQCPERDLRARGHSLLASWLHVSGRADAALHHGALGVSEAPPTGDVRIAALQSLARVRWRSTHQTDQVLPLLDEAEALDPGTEPVSDELRGARLSLRASIVSRSYRDHDLAESLHGRALSHWAATGNQHAVNAAFYQLSVAAQHAGKNQLALERLDRVIESAQVLGDQRRLSQAWNVRGNALCGLRQWHKAIEAFKQAGRIAWAIVAPYEMSFVFWNLPRPLMHVGEPLPGLLLAGFAEQHWQSNFGLLNRADRQDLRRIRRLARRLVSESIVELQWQRGRTMGLQEAVGVALDCLDSPGSAAHSEGS